MFFYSVASSTSKSNYNTIMVFPSSQTALDAHANISLADASTALHNAYLPRPAAHSVQAHAPAAAIATPPPAT